MNEIKIGVVVIGRNEGDRLKACLQSVMKQTKRIVYVDSGSNDDSVQCAKSIAVQVKELDMKIPFSAGRARNEGFSLLLKSYPEIKYVQFIDGDCELVDCALNIAGNFLEEATDTAIVSGRRKERYPEKSVYNLLCDIEWDTPVGESQACGGDFMVAVDAFEEVNGFNTSVVAGEEPELCYRLRLEGNKIYRLDYLMTTHDANITTFSAWWKRSVRCGHAYAQGYFMHAKEKERYNAKECLRSWGWGFLLPLIIVMSALLLQEWYLFLVLVYPIQTVRIYLSMLDRVDNRKNALIYSVFILIDKFPQLVGQLIFIKKYVTKSGITLIEYK